MAATAIIIDSIAFKKNAPQVLNIQRATHTSTERCSMQSLWSKLVEKQLPDERYTGRWPLEYTLRECSVWRTLSKNALSHKSPGRLLSNLNFYNAAGLSKVRVTMYSGWEKIPECCIFRYACNI